MDQLLFRLDNLSKKKIRRIRRLSQPPSMAAMSAQVSLWLAAGGVGVYGFGLLLPNVVGILVGTPSAVIKGNVLIGSHVAIIRDISRSMEGTEAELNAQIDRLTASGMTTEVRHAQAFGVSQTGGPANVLHQIEEVLNASPKPDAIYAFSDFKIETNMPAWKSDPEGYARLRALLAGNHARLYLGTVSFPPPNPLVVIARESGGGLIDQ
jgi:hypothetical protein